MTLSNDSPWVSIDVSPAIGNVWRCKHIHHMTGAENQGRHNIFIDCYQVAQVVRDGSVQIKWAWVGQRSDEIAKPAICNKRAPDHGTDIPIEKGMYISLFVDDGKGTPSDMVHNLHAVMDGADGNSWHHQSYVVTFEMIIALPPVQPPVTGQPPTTPPSSDVMVLIADLQARDADKEHRLQLIERLINAKG